MDNDKCRDCGLVADGVLHKIFLCDTFRLTREMVDTKFGADCLHITVSDLEEKGFRDLPKLVRAILRKSEEISYNVLPQFRWYASKTICNIIYNIFKKMAKSIPRPAVLSGRFP